MQGMQHHTSVGRSIQQKLPDVSSSIVMVKVPCLRQGSDVVAITNYIDVGLEVATDYAPANGDTPPSNGAALAVAWQVHSSARS